MIIIARYEKSDILHADYEDEVDLSSLSVQLNDGNDITDIMPTVCIYYRETFDLFGASVFCDVIFCRGI